MSSIRKLYINSAPGFRDPGGTDENFTITKTISDFTTVPRRVKLQTAQVPYTWNNIVSGSNNSFEVIIGTNTYTINIASGHYTGTSLATAVQAALNSATTNNFTVSYSTITFLFTFSSILSAYSFNFNVANTIAPALGFDILTYNSTTSSPYTLTSVYVSVVETDTQIFVCSTLVLGLDNGVIPYFPGAPPNYGILAALPLTSCFGSFMNYTVPNDEPWFTVSQSAFTQESINPNSTVSIGFSLLFISGIPVNLQGAHWSATILLDFA